MNYADYIAQSHKLKPRYLELRKRLFAMGAEPLNYPCLADPHFTQFVTMALDIDATPENIEQVTSWVNKLILVIDGEVPVSSLVI